MYALLLLTVVLNNSAYIVSFFHSIINKHYSNKYNRYLGSGSVLLHSSSRKITTYKEVEITNKDRNEKVSILIDESYNQLIQGTLKDSKYIISGNTLQEWVEKGLVYNTDDGAAVTAITSNEKDKKRSINKKKRLYLDNASTYVNIGTDEKPLYLNSEKKAMAKDIEKGLVDKDTLSSGGFLFSNLSHLFLDETVTARADDIAIRIRDNYPMTSPLWKRWTSKTNSYNSTSLTQVVAEYFQDYSIGDIGAPSTGDGKDYVPKRGYPGTLAPGETFKQLYALADLPRRILHPWPAFQELQFHVRWPPNHPLIPPPLLWFGLNNMYTDNFTNWELTREIKGRTDDEVIGGTFMEARDAMLIAKNAKFGRCFVQEEQIEHGGMIFYNGHKIPNYTPDHGPTVSTEEAEPPIPEFLLPLTERWLDPLHGVEVERAQVEGLLTDERLIKEFESEEDMRKRAAEGLLKGRTAKVDLLLDAEMKERGELEDTILKEFEEKALRRKMELGALLDVDNYEDIESIRDENGVVSDELVPEVDRQRSIRYAGDLYQIKSLKARKARSNKQLILYNIDVMQDTQREMAITQSDITVSRSKKKRRKTKRVVDEEDDDETVVTPPPDAEAPLLPLDEE